MDLAHNNPQPLILSLAPGLYSSIDVLITDSYDGNLTLTVGAGSETQPTTTTGAETISFVNKTLGAGDFLVLDA
jgi:hypothetical protein